MKFYIHKEYFKNQNTDVPPMMSITAAREKILSYVPVVFVLIIRSIDSFSSFSSE